MMSSSFLLTLLLFESVEPHMGTLFRIQVYTETAEQAKAAFQSAFARIAQLDDILTDYKSTSELSRATRGNVGQPVPISPELFTVLSAGLRLAEKTDGAFDVTLGPLTHLWRMHQLPTEADLARTGFRKMHLDQEAQTVSFDMPGMQLDVGGIAKGYAADEALAVLTKMGIQSALVAASGDLTFSNAPPGQPGWKIATAGAKPVFLENAAVSTSGASEQNFQAGGVRYSHILNPKTGRGVTTGLTTTVISPKGIDADSLATALNVLGPESSEALLLQYSKTTAIFSRAPAL